MINQKDIAEALLECGNKRNAIQEMAKLLIEWDAELEQMESQLRSLASVTRTNEEFEQRFVEAAQLQFPGMESFDSPQGPQEVPATELRRRHGRKPDTQVIEEIFREYGPLHVFDLVPIAQERGVPFTGNKPASQMARDKMYSCKRFTLFGNNVWGLPGQEFPEKYKHRGRGNRPTSGWDLEDGSEDDDGIRQAV